MKGIGYVALLMVMLTVTFTMCSGCSSVGGANYEEHGIYDHNGKYLQSVGNDKELMASSSTKPDMTRRDSAWSRHSDSVYHFPRKSDFTYNPASMLWINVVPLDGSSPPTLTEKNSFNVDEKPIGKAELLFHKKGRYLMSYILPFSATEEYILIEY